MLALIKRYVKFLGMSLLSTGVELLVLWLLSDYVFHGKYWGEYMVSPTIAFEISLAVNFLVSYYYIWKDRTQTREKGFLRLFVAYNLSSTAVFLLRLGVILIVEMLLGWDVLICNIIAMCFSGILNFLVSNNLVFRRRKA
jgi:putative flippase GtrA